VHVHTCTNMPLFRTLFVFNSCSWLRSSVERTVGSVDLATTVKIRRLQFLYLRLNVSRAVYILTLIFHPNFRRAFLVLREPDFIIFPFLLTLERTSKFSFFFVGRLQFTLHYVEICTKNNDYVKQCLRFQILNWQLEKLKDLRGLWLV
jgi:hypothetical protein